VAPDLGAAKLAERYGKALGLPVALVHKKRLTGSSVVAQGTVGQVRGNRAIIVDDLISTGATIEAAVRALADAGCCEESWVVATHALLAGGAVERLSALGIGRLLVTDSVAHAGATPSLPLEEVSLAPLLAEELRRMESASSW
jgi:ribose-phosphate pyrophosphokinase